jgi:tetratricopeptide (TPR) repeat protein
MNAGDREGQVRYATEAVEVGGDDAPAIAYYHLGQSGVYTGDFAEAVEHLRRAEAIAAATNDLTTQVITAGALVTALSMFGDVEAARRLIPEAIELAERLGNPTLTASCYLTSGEALALSGSPQEAIAMLDKGLSHADEGGPIMASGIRVLYPLLLDDAAEAARMLRPALPLAKEQLSGWYQLAPFVAAAKIAVRTGKDELAARLLGAYLAQRDVVGSSGYLSEGYWSEQLVNELRARLGQAALDDELRLGAQLTLPQALQLASELVDATA